MRMSPRSSSGVRSAMLWSTTAAGTISQTARGLSSFFTKSAREAVPTAFSRASSSTTVFDRSKTTHWCPPLSSRRTMLAPIRPSPIIPNCIDDSLFETAKLTLRRSVGRLVGGGGVQSLHGRSDPFVVPEDRGARDEDRGARADDQRRGRPIDASVHLEVASRLDSVDHLANPPDLGQGRGKEMLVAESRVHGHHEHLVDVLQDLLEHGRRSRWV